MVALLLKKVIASQRKRTLRNSELDTNVLLLIYHWVNHRGNKCMCKFVRVSRNMALNLYKRWPQRGNNRKNVNKNVYVFSLSCLYAFKSWSNSINA